MIKRSVLVLLLMLVSFALFQYMYSGTLDEEVVHRSGFEIIAHRGVSQDYHRENLDNKTCTASRIYKPRHDFFQNTLESIQAAFDYGATMVEIDIRPSKDKQLVVFHDNTLDCRTNASGNVWDYTVDELKRLDVGYGYTFDDGKTFPFRNKGLGKIHTLDEVLRYFPHRKFLIDNKSGNNLEVAKLIVKSLSLLTVRQQKNIFMWSQDVAYEYVNTRLPTIKRLLLPRYQHKVFYKKYLLSMGMANIGDTYSDQGLGLPVEYTRYVWGWPNRFLNKIYARGVRFYLLVSNAEELESVSGIPLDGIITDNIDLLSKHLNSFKNQLQTANMP